MPGRLCASATFNTGSCKQPPRSGSTKNLPADSAWNLEDHQSGYKDIEKQYNKDETTNLDRLAVVVYLPVLVHPKAVNVGVQDHLQGINKYIWEAKSVSPQRMESSG